MSGLAHTGTPLEVPAWVHLVLWPAVIVWAVTLRSARRGHRLLGSARLGFGLSFVCFLVDGATLAVAISWPTPAADSFVFGLLWIAALFSVSAYLILRAPDGGDDGGRGGRAGGGDRLHPGAGPGARWRGGTGFADRSLMTASAGGYL